MRAADILPSPRCLALQIGIKPAQYMRTLSARTFGKLIAAAANTGLVFALSSFDFQSVKVPMPLPNSFGFRLVSQQGIVIVVIPCFIRGCNATI